MTAGITAQTTAKKYSCERRIRNAAVYLADQVQISVKSAQRRQSDRSAERGEGDVGMAA